MSEPFDLEEHLGILRCHSTDWLRARDQELEREQRRLRVEQLAVRRVLDERGAARTLPDAQRSTQTVRAETEVARALESRPSIAAAAHAGELSWDQLQPLVEVATPETDAEWARRGPGCAPIDLQRMAREARVVTVDESAARHEARGLRMWWRPDAGMLQVRGQLADLEGALAETVLERMIEGMRPAKGERWDSRAHRLADAFVELCRNYSDIDPAVKGRSRPQVVVQVPPSTAARAHGVALAKAKLAAYLADTPARVASQLVDEHGALFPTSDLDQDSIPAEVRRFVLLRDTHCRTPGCEETRGLQIHHMEPQCRGTNHDPDKLAAVCPRCHPMYEPHGPWRLVGNPNEPDGLVLVHLDESLADARAGPRAGG